MANRFWIGGVGTWNASNTTSWSTASGGAGGASVPTVADDVFFDANSGTGIVTLTASSTGRSLNCTGYSGTISHTAAVTLPLGDATAGASNIALKFSTTMTYTIGSTTSSFIQFQSSSATQQTIDFGSKTTAMVSFTNTPGNYLLSTSMTMNAASSLQLVGCTLDTNNLNHTWGSFSSSNSNTRTLNLGSSTITMTGANWDCTTSTNMTLNAGTSVIGWTSSGVVTPTIAIPGLALYDVLITKSSGGSNINGTGVATFHNYNHDNTVLGGGNRALTINVTGGIVINGTLKYYGSSATNSGLLASGALGSSRTVALGSAGVADLNNVDFRDIAITGTATPVSGVRFGDGGGNSGVTFPASRTIYYIGNGLSWSTIGSWSLTSGGTSSGDIPLVHDSAIFDANSFTTTGLVVSMNNMRVCAVDASAATNSPTFRFTNPSGGGNSHYGSLIFPTAGCTIDCVGAAGSATSIIFFGRGTSILNFNGATSGASTGTAIAYTVNSSGGTVQMASNLIMAGANSFTVSAGTFDANGFNVSIGTLSSSSTTVRSILMRSGTWTLSGTGTIWNTGTATNLTFDAGTSTLVLNDTSASNSSMATGTIAFWNIQINGVGTGTFQFGANPRSFNNFTISGPKIVKITAGSGSAITVNGTFTAVGSAGNLITIQSGTAASQAFLRKTAGYLAGDYLNIQDINVTGGGTFFAGSHSTDAGDNTGWLFTDPAPIKVWNGSGYSKKLIKVWNGSAWVYKPLKRYTSGSIWQKTT